MKRCCTSVHLETCVLTSKEGTTVAAAQVLRRRQWCAPSGKAWLVSRREGGERPTGHQGRPWSFQTFSSYPCCAVVYVTLSLSETVTWDTLTLSIFLLAGSGDLARCACSPPWNINSDRCKQQQEQKQQLTEVTNLTSAQSLWSTSNVTREDQKLWVRRI